MKLSKTIVAGLLVLGMGSAFAAEPVALTDTQLDNVSAGGAAASAAALSLAVGFIGAATQDVTVTQVTQTNLGLGTLVSPDAFRFTSASSSLSVGTAF